ncbi:hypothetical protein [Agromyces bauzanensis]|uniref:Uncharacterized protein n=1 Tax=Agromyces bauzanensis TaxID=1308924 RepID=A0A917UN93_9MICO|nr:hypothetical protein [Agromyces bauzanensis]GGJ69462.1 hypothetical protein GCM10011372_04080 [Agromyces bauzanensis]
MLADHYPAGGPSDAADAALVRLLAAAPPPGRREHRDDGVLRVQLLVRAHVATAALILGDVGAAAAHPDAAFGAGARACPAPGPALAIATAVVDGLRP